MAPMAAILGDEAAVNNVAAYIATFPAHDASATINGDLDRGAYLFDTCKSCHGTNGEGIWALNAPRLNGVDDWYLKRQIENYKQGIRGAHPTDLYGKQMTLLSGTLRSEQDINDVVAYINTLK
jgi:cytochrome c oxidase subunit 2